MLYIVATPIGNLDDLSLRQAKTLSSAEIILAEDTRSASFLLSKITEKFSYSLNPNQKIISYYKETEFQKLPEIISWLEEEKEIALISEAGMPVISDPGYLLVSTVVKRNIPFTVIPGISSVVNALVLSGFKQKEFMFVGFLPKKESELKKICEKLTKVKELFSDSVFIAFESPHRVNKTLEIFETIFPDSEIAVCREMTKKFEEVVRGSAKELKERKYKGEITLVIKLVVLKNS